MKKSFTLFILFIFIFSGCSQKNRNIYIADFSKFFSNYQGSFVLLDYSSNFYIKYNVEQCNKRFSPCSTFKIPNSLIGLETGVIPDENFILKWDGVKRDIDLWNQDHTLKTAIKYSVVWYYQEIARRIGDSRMKEFINKIGYGNNDISGGIDKFWLMNSLEISTDEQVEFLKKFYSNQLPFSHKNLDIVKSITILDSNENYIFRGKTGSGHIQSDNNGLGWFVGYVTQKDSTYIFAANITGEGANGMKAKEIVIEILKSLKIM